MSECRVGVVKVGWVGVGWVVVGVVWCRAGCVERGGPPSLPPDQSFTAPSTTTLQTLTPPSPPRGFHLFGPPLFGEVGWTR